MGGSTKKTVQTTEPAAFAKPFYEDIGRRTGRAVDTVQSRAEVLPTQLIAQPRPAEVSAASSGVDFAKALGSEIPQGTFSNNAVANARGDWLGYESNPYLPGAIESAINPLYEQLTREILPGISQTANAQGAFGGDRHGLMEGVALEGFGDAATQIAAQLAYDNYGRERTRMMDAPQDFTQSISAETLPLALEGSFGAQQRMLDSLAIQEALGQYELGLTAPFAGLGEASNILSAQGSTATQTAPTGSKLGGAITGGLGGAAATAALASNPAGWLLALGGGLGALAGGLG